MLLGGRNNKTEISVNHLMSDRSLECLVARICNIECYGAVKKIDLKKSL